VTGNNPYHFGTPVEGEFFVGRESEVNTVVDRVSNGINVVLLSPRRYGKTSVLLRAETQLATQKAAMVHINVLRHPSYAAFASALATNAFNIRGGAWHRARQATFEFVKRLRVRPVITMEDDGKLKLSFDPGLAGHDASQVLSDILGLLAAERPHRPAALILDEFQAIIDLDAHLPAILKGLVDEHPNVSLVTAGSKRHLMERLYLSRNAPLFNTAEKIALGPIPDRLMATWLVRRAAHAGKRMTMETAKLIIDVAGPVPDDIQHLAHTVFLSSLTDQISAQDVTAGLGAIAGQLEHVYSEQFSVMSIGQRRVLRLLAITPVSAPGAASFVRRAGLANPSSVKKALDVLEEAELVVHRDGIWQVADPFIATWLRRDGTKDI